MIILVEFRQRVKRMFESEDQRKKREREEFVTKLKEDVEKRKLETDERGRQVKEKIMRRR